MAKKKDQSPQYVVSKPFKGNYNNREFNCKPGDVITLNPDEFATYSRFLNKENKQ